MFSVSSASTSSPTAATEGSIGSRSGSRRYGQEPAGTGRGRGLVKAAAAVLAAGLVAAGTLVGASAAAAAPADETGQHQGGATAVLDGLKTYDSALLRTAGENGEQATTQELPAGLFELDVDGGGQLKTYCIDIHNPTQDRAK